MLYEELSQKFPCQVIQPFREPVIIVDAKEFKPQWEAQLKSEGCKILVSDYLGRTCFLIRKPNSNVDRSLINMPKEEEKPNVGITMPTSSQPNVGSAEPTSSNVEEAVAQLVEQGLGFKEIQQRLGLTSGRLMGVFSSLSRKGVLQKLGWVPMRKRSRKPSSNSRVQIPALKLKDAKPSLNASLPVREMLQASLKILDEHPKVAKFLLEKCVEALT
jgi:hypothetical protein